MFLYAHIVIYIMLYYIIFIVKTWSDKVWYYFQDITNNNNNGISYSKVQLNPIPYGLRPTPIPYGGGTILPPLSKIPENGRLGLNLWIYTKYGLKFQKNPNQLHTKS